MKESINKFLSLSEYCQNIIKNLYNDTTITENDKLILSKLFGTNNLVQCKNQDNISSPLNLNFLYKPTIYIGDAVLNKKTGAAGIVQNIRATGPTTYYVDVISYNNINITWEYCSDIQVLNKYNISDEVYIDSIKCRARINKIFIIHSVFNKYIIKYNVLYGPALNLEMHIDEDSISRDKEYIPYNMLL